MDNPEFGHAIPELPSSDVSAALFFYVNRLGFEEQRRIGDRPVMYGVVKRGDAQINLWFCENPDIAKNTSCRIPVRDIDALYREYQLQDVIHPNGELVEQPWGAREFVALDRDGNALRFFTRT